MAGNKKTGWVQKMEWWNGDFLGTLFAVSVEVVLKIEDISSLLFYLQKKYGKL